MTVFLIFFLASLLALSAFLSSSETALFSLSPLTLRFFKNSSDKNQMAVFELMQKPRELLVTILMLNILANILVQNTVSSLFDEYEGWALKVGVPLALTLVFGEILPKSLALPNNTRMAPRIAPFFLKAARFLKVIRDPLTRLASFLSRFLFFFLKEEKEISADELRHVLKASEASGVLLKEESRLTSGAMDLQRSMVKERMRPRDEILFYDLKEPLTELSRLFVDLGTTRIPVCKGGLENLLGILSLRRYFLYEENIHQPSDLSAVLKKPYYVPETTRCWTLLRALRERGESLAIVVDEYGSISGLITQEDLVEAVVGEIKDLRDNKSLFTKSGEDVMIASGKMELAEFNEIFGASLTSEENTVTLGGWLIEQLADIPQVGAKYATDEFLFYILAADPNRIRRIYIRRLKP